LGLGFGVGLTRVGGGAAGSEFRVQGSGFEFRVPRGDGREAVKMPKAKGPNAKEIPGTKRPRDRGQKDPGPPASDADGRETKRNDPIEQKGKEGTKREVGIRGIGAPGEAGGDQGTTGRKDGALKAESRKPRRFPANDADGGMARAGN